MPTGTQFGIILYLGFVTVALPTIFDMKAYAIVKSWVVLSLFRYLVPIFSGFFAFWWNRERGFNYATLFVGLLLISSGVYFANRAQDKKQEE